MTLRNHAWCSMLLVIFLAPVAQADEPMGMNTNQMKLGAFPGLPTCIPGAVVKGDPAKEAFIAYAKVEGRCVVPWHWHTANEHLIVVSGVLHMETKDGKPLMLRAGGFAMMPSHHAHQASCLKSCSIYVYSDGPFDMHYIDANGNETTPDDALKTVKEKPGRPPG
jgi:quercetin dioxygenase-like cupin family protein